MATDENGFFLLFVKYQMSFAQKKERIQLSERA